MAVRPIRLFGDPVLRTKAEPVVDFDRELRQLVTDLIEEQAAAATDGLVSELRINWVWMPPWGPDKITDEGREQLRALGFNV